MSKNISRFLNIYFIIILLPSCSRINNLIDKHFFEGCRPCPYFAKAHDYMTTLCQYMSNELENDSNAFKKTDEAYYSRKPKSGKVGGIGRLVGAAMSIGKR